MPDGFPNVELRHRFTVSGSGSGSVFLDNIFFRPLPAPTDTRWQEWIGFGSRWRYLASSAPMDWFSENFDDASWPEAVAKFGQGTGPQNIVTAVPKNQPAYYFRKKFVVPVGNYEELLLSGFCTDDYGGTVYPMRIWFNGAEVPAGGIEAVSGEGNIVKYFDLTPFLDLVPSGTNTIAVMLNNTWQPDWDNVAFDISLKAIPANYSTAKLSSITVQKDGTVTLNVQGTPQSKWTVQSSSTPNSGWIFVQEVVVGASGSSVAAVPASAASARYYRLLQSP
jgi:hypothetical protein